MSCRFNMELVLQLLCVVVVTATVSSVELGGEPTTQHPAVSLIKKNLREFTFDQFNYPSPEDNRISRYLSPAAYLKW